jgi:hypothetical protein
MENSRVELTGRTWSREAHLQRGIPINQIIYFSDGNGNDANFHLSRDGKSGNLATQDSERPQASLISYRFAHTAILFMIIMLINAFSDSKP